MGLLGEHGDRGGAAALVGAHDLLAARALPDRARRRRAPLVLGDHRGAGAHQRLGERAALGLVPRLALELGQAAVGLAPLERVASGRDERFEPWVHAAAPSAAVRFTNRSSTSRAEPSSMASSARRTPASRLSARPAT